MLTWLLHSLIHWDWLYTSQNITYIFGVWISSVDMTVTLTQERKQKTLQSCGIERKWSSDCQTVSRFYWALHGTFCWRQIWPLSYREMGNDKKVTLRKTEGNFDTIVKFSNKPMDDIRWWKDDVKQVTIGVNISHGQTAIYTDASLAGWGRACIMGNTEGGGYWDEEESLSHTNILELKARLFHFNHSWEKKMICTSDQWWTTL